MWRIKGEGEIPLLKYMKMMVLCIRQIIILVYFMSLFQNTFIGDSSSVLDTITCVISSYEKLMLGKPYSSDNVKLALCNIILEKAPGPNGMTVTF